MGRHSAPLSVAMPADWIEWRRDVVHNPPDLNLDGSVVYQDGWAVLMPQTPGVYFIHDLRGCIYVGRTSDLSVRYRQHDRDSHNRDLTVALRHPVAQPPSRGSAAPTIWRVSLSATTFVGFGR
jgi:hypothetical protein